MKKTAFTHPLSFHAIQVLTAQRNSGISSKINNLKLADVKDDNSYAKTVERIKNEVLLTPVAISDPTCNEPEYEEIKPSVQQLMLGLSNKDHFIHEVTFLVTGDTILFNYSPSGMSSSSSSSGIVKPQGSSIKVYVDLPNVNPEAAKARAKLELTLTQNLITGNNAQIKDWNIATENHLTEALETKRMKLISMFG